MVVLLVPCLSMLFIRQQSMHMLQENIQNNNKLALDKNGLILEEEMGRITHMIEELVGNSQIQNFLVTGSGFTGSANLYKAQDAANVISYFFHPLKYDDCIDILVYNGSNDTVISNEIPYSASPLFYGSLLQYPDMDFSQWKDSMVTSVNRSFFLGMRSITYNGKEYQAITLVQPVVISGHRSSIIVLIDAREIASIFSSIHVPGGAVYIETGEGELITASFDGDPRDLDNIRNNSREMMEYTYICRNTGWHITAAVPMQYFEQQTLTIRNLSLLSIAFSITAGILLTVLLSFRNAKPYRDIHHLLVESGSQAPSFQYKQLKGSISAIIENNQQLKASLAEQNVLLRSDFIRKVIKGEIVEKELIHEMALHYNIHIESSCFLIAVLRLTDTQELPNHPDLDSLAKQNVMVTTMASSLCGSTVYSYNQKDSELVFLLGQDTDNGHPSDLKTVLHTFCLRLEECGIPFLIASGSIKNELSDAYESYTEAMETLKTVDWQQTKLAFYEDVVFSPTLSFYYPSDVESKLIRSIRHGDTERIRNIVRMLYNSNFRKRTLNRTSYQILIDCIFHTILKLSEKINFYQLYEPSIRTLKENTNLEHAFIQLEDLLVSISETHYRRQNSLADEIMQYMQLHYTEGGLTLHDIAGQFGMTEANAYNFFKETWQKTFSVILEELRINHSIALLKKPDWTIEQISVSVGYNSSHSYRRAFKRVTGLTPSEYKDKFLSAF